MCDWLTLVTNGASAEKPDHIRHNAVNAVRMAASSVVSIAHDRCRADDGWNVLALRSGFYVVSNLCVFLITAKHVLSTITDIYVKNLSV